jgi:hypothetical protein
VDIAAVAAELGEPVVEGDTWPAVERVMVDEMRPDGVVSGHLASRQERTRSTARSDDLAWINNNGRSLTPAALDHLVRRRFARAGARFPMGGRARIPAWGGDAVGKAR